jgi:hypothetical protein
MNTADILASIEKLQARQKLCRPDSAEWLDLSECLAPLFAEMATKQRKNTARRERDQSMRDLGLVKVRGSLGGTYWE